MTAAALLLCGCADSSADAEKLPYDGSYHMISDGTSVVVYEDNSVPSISDHAAFYIPEGMETVYASAHLDREQSELYGQLLESTGNFSSPIPMEADSSIYSTMLNIIGVEQLSYSHISGRKAGGYDMEAGRFLIDMSYRFTPEEMSNMNRASEAAANEIMKGVTAGMTEYDKLKYFHDYLIRNCESDISDPYANTIYGALVRGVALCEGYAKSFSYLCNKAGIENMIITGETSEHHMWNMVKVEGNWYHIDVTWDNPEGELSRLYPDMVLYQYFMVTDSVIENDHKITSIGYEPPQAFSTKENYFHKEKLYVSSESEVETAAENAFRSAVSRGEHTAMIKFDTTNLMLSTVHEITEASENGEIYFKDMIDRVSADYGKEINVSWTNYYSPYRIIVFVIEYKD